MIDPVVAAFRSLVVRDPARRLVVSPGRRPITALDLASLAEVIQARILEMRIPPGSLVGVAARGVAFLASLVAVLQARSAVLLLDPGGLAATQENAAIALGAFAVLRCESDWPGDSDAFRLERVTPSHVAVELPRGTAFVKTTSGSTGTPRGVAVSSDAMLADEHALSAAMGIEGDARIVAAIPLAHSYGLASVAMPALVRGAMIVLPDSATPLSPIIAARGAEASVFPTVPAYLGALLRMSRPPAWPSSIRLVVSAGAPLSSETAVRFRQFSGRPVQVLYGASECGGICFDREGTAGERGTVGTPLDGVQVDLEPVGLDTGAGLINVTSPAAGLGYLPRPDVERLAAGRFRASDVARWEAGEIKLLHRIDTLINVRGKKVDPSEIEAALAELSGVQEIVAVGIPDPAAGGHRLRVVIACQPGRLTSEDVHRFCRSRLADYMVPRSIRLVAEIPRTERGKIDRAALAEGP